MRAKGTLRWLGMIAAFLLVLVIVFVPILFLLARTPLHDGDELPGALLLAVTLLVSGAVALLCTVCGARVITAAAAIYSAAAWASWTFFNAPGAGIHQMPSAVVALLVVLIPYALWVLVHRRSLDALSQAAMRVASVMLALIALWAYWPAFLSYDVGDDPEYGLVFWAAPGIQVLLVLAAQWWRFAPFFNACRRERQVP